MFSAEADIDDLLARFEARTLPHEEWTHGAHLAVAALTIMNHGDGALDYLRENIRRLNAAHGVVETPQRGYHETITVAWVAMVRAHLRSLPSETSRLDKLNQVVETFQDKYTMLQYYSRDRIMSVEARYEFLEPDLEPLP